MAGSVNKVILVGNVGKDPEVRTTQAGSKIVSFSLATSENWNDRTTGERKEKTEWHRVVVFNERLADVVEKYVRKGRKLYIEAAIETRKYTDQAGVEKYTTEIVLKNFRGELVLLDGRGDEAGAAEGGGYSRERAPARAAAGASKSAAPSWDAPKGGGDLDDEIPF